MAEAKALEVLDFEQLDFKASFLVLQSIHLTRLIFGFSLSARMHPYNTYIASLVLWEVRKPKISS